MKLMILPAALLFLLGLCAGSFVNALVWRVREQEKDKKTSGLSILSGRSICPNCRHVLAARDLIPILSWLTLRGRCRYCQAPISAQYPVIELAAGLVFVFSYIFWPGSFSTSWGIVLFASWLITSVGLLALLVYDARWMMLPNRILYPTAAVAVVGRAFYIVGFEPDKADALVQWGLAVAVASGIFWLLFVISQGRWIGFGDVRLGLITGTVLATPALGFLMIFTASVLGTLFVLPALVRRRQKISSKVPFGPFLIAATFLVLLFGQPLVDWYKDLII